MLGLLLPSKSQAREAWRGWCEVGNQSVITSGLTSTTKVERSFPQCTVTVFTHGGGLATIYADNNGTPKANPFTANLDGSWIFYADDGRYDIQNSGANFPTPFTYLDVLLCDPFAAGAVCAGGGGGAPHNLLSTTHLDTMPFSPPVRGDIITAQNQISPAGTNPSWARLALGTATYVLTSNGTDAVWAPPTGGGSGCTPSGAVDTGVLSEHPIGVCYDSLHWTWDDGVSKQVMLLGDGSNTVQTNNSLTFFIGDFNNSQAGAGGAISEAYLVGNSNSITPRSTASGDFYIIGRQSFSNNTAGKVWLIGDNNFTTGLNDPGANDSQIYLFGRNNSVHSISGTANISDCQARGESNEIRAASTVTGLGSCLLDGFSNSLAITGGTGSYFSIGVYGESNTLTGTANGIQRTHVLGNANIVKDTLALTDQAVLVGDANEVDGSISTVQILGFKNVAHNVSAQNSATVNTTLVGSAIAATNTGATGSPAYQGAFGATLTLSNCTGCWIVGQGVTNSTNNTLAIGMSASATPALIIAANGSGDNVFRTPHTFSYYPACAGGTEGSFAAVTDSTTNTQGATVTGSGSFHVAAYCNGTNWIVWGSSTTNGKHAISFSIGTPGGTALTAGATTTDYISVPFACTINRYTLMIDAGTITVKFWKVALGTAIPTSGNSINTSGVGISSGTAITSTTLSDFTTTSVAANDAIAMNVTAVSTAAFVNGVLSCAE